MMKKITTFFLVLTATLMTVTVHAQTEITCAEAREYALSVSANNVLYNDGATYVMQGYVTAIQTAWSSSWKNVSFWIADTENGGKVIQAYRCVANTQDEAPNVGSLVRVTGQLTRYNSTPEVAAGCTCEMLSNTEPPTNLGEKTIEEFINLANTKDTCILRGVVTEIVSSQYGNFHMDDNTASVYVYGLSRDAAGNSLTFNSLGIGVGDTVKLSGIYQLYGSTHEVTSARYISHAKPVEPQEEEYNIDFATSFATGWDAWIGKTITFTNDFVYCDTWNNTIAPSRIRNAEEYGEEGSDAYNAALAKQAIDSCHLLGYTIPWQTYRTGTLVRGLKAYIPAANQLQAVNVPELINNNLPTERPDLGEPDLVIVGANIENFFVTNVGFDSHGAQSEEQLVTQKAKIKAALSNMNADIYALCEVEQGTAAVQALVDLLNEATGTTDFAYVNTGSSAYQNSAMVCFIYNKTKVQTYGTYWYPYTAYSMKWREAIQCFTHIATGERFNISMNHFYAKISKTDEDREDNMTKLITKLPSATYADPDVLVLGDLNAYTGETAVTLLSEGQGYVDLLMRDDPDGYSHLYGCTAGFLDHAYCSPSMASQVTKAVSYHINADTPSSLYSYAKGNESMYRYSDHDPILVGLKWSKNPSTDVENVTDGTKAHKQIRHGQLIIIRGAQAFTVTGQRL